MTHYLNTLFVTREGSWLGKSGETVEVRLNGEVLLRAPLHNLDGILCLGWDISASSHLMAACAESGVTLSFCTPHGRFLAAVSGFTPGNVLLRREQYRRADRSDASLLIARQFILAKIANSRSSLQRTLRDRPNGLGNDHIQDAVKLLKQSVGSAERTEDRESLIGIEGDAAVVYFGAFSHMLTTEDPTLVLNGRNRRPPRDPVNALLSFSYSLLAHDCRSALEACGLDAAVGFLHRDRPGRPSLALDLMEEFRPFLADRLVLGLFNRKQITANDFDHHENGAVLLKDEARKKVLVAWQERKRESLTHPFLNEKMEVGLLPHIQARLLARHLRGDLDLYPAFLWK
ncbi:MAG: type I-C CRISPR-associated endonuclease Cas1 [Magnetococcales bacterium]|nr:type I-C CRISPR-associated endonuclease Cas1 [Magnetococcales bacterium]